MCSEMVSWDRWEGQELLICLLSALPDLQRFGFVLSLLLFCLPFGWVVFLVWFRLFFLSWKQKQAAENARGEERSCF